ncbi:hypothetical protein MSKU3_1553 [Komagataeibacter oboediens]|nr:hypothetical protein MSKU3_1553 [Komagataeibacter oboediens]
MCAMNGRGSMLPINVVFACVACTVTVVHLRAMAKPGQVMIEASGS